MPSPPSTVSCSPRSPSSGCSVSLPPNPARDHHPPEQPLEDQRENSEYQRQHQSPQQLPRDESHRAECGQSENGSKHEASGKGCSALRTAPARVSGRTTRIRRAVEWYSISTPPT